MRFDDRAEMYRNIESIIRRLQSIGTDVAEKKPMSKMLLKGLWTRLDELVDQVDLYVKDFGESDA